MKAPEPSFCTRSGARIAYYEYGKGGPVLLVHGFASSAQVNWFGTSWVKTLCDAGYRCIALDNRGHGESEKFYSADDYGPDIIICRCHWLAGSSANRFLSGDWLFHGGTYLGMDGL